MSHRSSGTSLNVSENLGVVSKASTPLDGSLENLGGGELLRKNFGGNNNGSGSGVVGGGVRRGLASGSQSPLVTNSRTLSSTLPRKNVKDNQDVAAISTLDDWEQKLLGKKSAVPYVSPTTAATASSVKSETLSIQSSNHSSRSNTLERNRKEAKSSAPVIPSNLATLPTHQVTYLLTYYMNLCIGSV